jgi:hypothetical protein
MPAGGLLGRQPAVRKVGRLSQLESPQAGSNAVTVSDSDSAAPLPGSWERQAASAGDLQSYHSHCPSRSCSRCTKSAVPPLAVGRLAAVGRFRADQATVTPAETLTQMRKSIDGRASIEETHGGPTATQIVASEQDTNRHSHDGDQARIKLNAQGNDQEAPEHAQEVTHGSAKEDGTGVSGLGPPASLRQGSHGLRGPHTGGRNDRLVPVGWRMWSR